MPKRLPQIEFIALMAMMFAMIAFSIDAMLPAMPEIARDLSPEAPNRAQLVLTSFLLGMGVGTFITGPLSDSFGRKPVMLGGVVLYVIGAYWAGNAETLDSALAGRVLQGLGVAGPRAVGMAMIRDLYSGREMARLNSFVMMVFTLVPALAPLVGAGIIQLSGWRGIFWAFILFAAICTAWLMIRQSETLPPDRRRPLRLGVLWSGLVELFAHPLVRGSIIVQCLTFAILFSMLSSIQQIYDVTFGRADSFPLWFGGVAIVAGTSSLLNARLVMRLGMRRVATVTLAAQIGLSGLMALGLMLGLSGAWAFAAFVLWQATVFFQAGLTIGNLNALAMEPVGHIAGMASSLISSVATVVSLAIAAPVGLAFDGTPLPLALGVLLFAALATLMMLRLPRSPHSAE